MTLPDIIIMQTLAPDRPTVFRSFFLRKLRHKLSVHNTDLRLCQTLGTVNAVRTDLQQISVTIGTYSPKSRIGRCFSFFFHQQSLGNSFPKLMHSCHHFIFQKNRALCRHKIEMHRICQSVIRAGKFHCNHFTHI